MGARGKARTGGIKVLTVRQPWAWLIVNRHKDIENRSWKTHYRGPLLIQASAHTPQRDLEEGRLFARKRGVKVPEDLENGGIVGMVNLVDCVEESRNKWFEGPVGWVLSNPKKLDFIPLKGRLGLFDPPARVRKELGVALYVSGKARGAK